MTQIYENVFGLLIESSLKSSQEHPIISCIYSVMPAIQSLSTPFYWKWQDVNAVDITGFVYKTKWKAEFSNTGFKKSTLNAILQLLGDYIHVNQRLVVVDEIEILKPGGAIVLHSPDGTRYAITVLNGGTIASGGSGSNPPPPGGP